jgi:MFS family permease
MLNATGPGARIVPPILADLRPERLPHSTPEPKLIILEEMVENISAVEGARSGIGVHGARRLAFEGAFQAVAQGLGEAYLGAYALFLGAGGLTLGLVATLPTAATSAAQFLARRVGGGAGGTRRVLRRVWSAQAAGYAALGLCVLAPFPWSVIALIVLGFLAWGCGGVAIPMWTSLVSGAVPTARHGWFFGLRGAAQAAGALAAILGGGALLSLMTGSGLEALGFGVIFAYAALARVAGAILLPRLPNDTSHLKERHRSIGLRPARSSRKFKRLSLYLWSLHLATYVSSPFFVPYMLKELRFSYLLIGALIATPAVVKVCTLRVWGRLADKTGPGPILRTTGWLVAPVPALWLLSASPWWILAAQVYSGLAWGAFELAQASSILATTRGRERQIAWFNTVDGGVLIAGSLLGGMVVNLVNVRGGAGYLSAMALSTALRLVPALALLWRVRGIGRPSFSHLLLPLRVWTVRPTRGLSLRIQEGIALVVPGRGRHEGTVVQWTAGRSPRWAFPLRGRSPSPSDRKTGLPGPSG